MKFPESSLHILRHLSSHSMPCRLPRRWFYWMKKDESRHEVFHLLCQIKLLLPPRVTWRGLLTLSHLHHVVICFFSLQLGNTDQLALSQTERAGATGQMSCCRQRSDVRGTYCSHAFLAMGLRCWLLFPACTWLGLCLISMGLISAFDLRKHLSVVKLWHRKKTIGSRRYIYNIYDD